MWSNGRAPYKVARTENENDISGFSNISHISSSNQQHSPYDHNDNNNNETEQQQQQQQPQQQAATTSSSSGNRLHPATNSIVLASCSGCFISVVVSAIPGETTHNNSIVQLEVWRHNNNSNSPIFTTRVVLPKSFFVVDGFETTRENNENNNEVNNNNNNNSTTTTTTSGGCPLFSNSDEESFLFDLQRQRSIFVGEGVDGTSIVMCDRYGNAGTISIVGNSNNNRSSYNNNNNNNQHQVYLHTNVMQISFLHPDFCGRNNKNNNNNIKQNVITALCCVDGSLFLGTNLGHVASLRVINHAGADSWVVLTNRNDETFANNNNNGSEQDQERNVSTNATSWTSRFFGGFFGATTQHQQQQDTASSSTAATTSSPVSKNENKNAVLYHHQQPNAVTRIFPSSIHQISSLEHPPAFYAVHGNTRVVFYGPCAWRWGDASSSSSPAATCHRVIAVGDCVESGAVYILHTTSASSSSNPANNSDLGEALQITLTSLNTNASTNSSSETLCISPLRLLTEEDLANSSIYPLRYDGERRALVVTPQYAVAYTVAVGPRAPTNEITILESKRYILNSQVVVPSTGGGETNINNNNNNIAGGVSSSSSLTLVLSGNSTRCVPLTEIFSSALDADNDRKLNSAISQHGPDGGFRVISDSIAIFSQSNPWNWSSQQHQHQQQQQHQRGDSNLLTFVTSSLMRRVRQHEQFIQRSQHQQHHYHSSGGAAGATTSSDLWSETSSATRFAILENQVGLSMLKAIRDIQNSCQVHASIDNALSALWNSDLDRAKYVSEVFCTLLPRAARHQKCIQPVLLHNENNNNNIASTSSSSSSWSAAEIIFHHPQNAFVFLFEASNVLREIISDVSVSLQDKLLWSSIVGSLWHSCCNEALRVIEKNYYCDDRARTTTAQNSSSSYNNNSIRLSNILSETEWLDSSLPQMVQSMSDSIAFSVSTTPKNRERQTVHSALVDLVADLVDITIRIISPSSAASPSADSILRSTLLREPFLMSSQFGYPFPAPKPDQQQQDAHNIGCRMMNYAERIAVRHSVYPIMWSFCSSAYLAATSVGENAGDGGSFEFDQQQQQNCHQKLKVYFQSDPEFFNFVAAAMLEQHREIELARIETVAPFVGTTRTEEVRNEYIATNAPSLVWTMNSAALDAVLKSGYEAHPAASFVSDVDGDSDGGADHRNVCASLAKLAWVAEGRPMKSRKMIEMESKTSLAQLRFLKSSSSTSAATAALNQTETIRALLSLSCEPGQNFIAACELAEGLPAADPSRPALLMEILTNCYRYEGARLIDNAKNSNIGDSAKLKILEDSLTVKTLNKSVTLIALCGQEDLETIGRATSVDFAQMLLHWRHLVR